MTNMSSGVDLACDITRIHARPMAYVPTQPTYVPQTLTSVSVTDIRMPFVSMVIFMIKWSLASIPAAIILATIFAVIGTIGFVFLAAVGTAILH